MILSWVALLIGGGIVILFFGLLVIAINGESNVKPKATKGKRIPQNTAPLIYPSMGYDSSGRKIPTTLEKQVEADVPFIQKIENQIKREAKLERLRKGRSAKERNHLRE